MKKKIFIYQLIPRLLTNKTSLNIPNGSIEENGSGKFNEISPGLLKQLYKSGYTHIWYIGIIAHASTTDYTAQGIPKQYPEIIKGRAGSPYAIRDYYDVNPDLAEDISCRMAEFEQLVQRTHDAGLKVIIDNIPNHVARNYQSVKRPAGVFDLGEKDDVTKAFSAQNNFYYLPGEPLRLEFPQNDDIDQSTYREFPAKVTGNDRFTNRPTEYDWYETVKLNYGVDYLNNRSTHFTPIPDTWVKMRDILLFWAAKKVDGFRCDMAEMVPLAFWRWAIPQIKVNYPEIIFIAEIYSPSLYRDFLENDLFDYLYDKVGLYDLLRDVSCGYRPSSDITFTLNNVGDIQHQMVNFMENHDEQRIASDFFLSDGAKAKAAMIVTATVNRNPVMIYAGQEFGERGMDQEGFSGIDGRTSIFDYWSIDKLKRWNNDANWNSQLLTVEERELADFYSRLINLCNDEKALSEGLFYDLMSANYTNPEFDSTTLYAFLRGNREGQLLIVVNFGHLKCDFTLNIPADAPKFMGVALEGGVGEKVTLSPLLNRDNSLELSFFDGAPIALSLLPHSGEIYKISFI